MHASNYSSNYINCNYPGYPESYGPVSPIEDSRAYREFHRTPFIRHEHQPERPRSQSPLLYKSCFDDFAPFNLSQTPVPQPPKPQPLFPANPICVPSTPHNQQGYNNQDYGEFDISIESVDFDPSLPMQQQSGISIGRGQFCNGGLMNNGPLQYNVYHNEHQQILENGMSNLVCISPPSQPHPIAPMPAPPPQTGGIGRGIRRRESMSGPPKSVGVGRGLIQSSTNTFGNPPPPRHTRIQGASAFPNSGSSTFGRPFSEESFNTNESPFRKSQSPFNRNNNPPSKWKVGLGGDQTDSPRQDKRAQKGHEEFVLKWGKMFADSKLEYPGCTFVDTHCHLDWMFSKSNNGKMTWSKFKAANRATWSPAFESCIADWCQPQLIINDTDGWTQAILESDLYHAAGVHPHFADKYEMVVDKLMQRLNHPKTIACGEMGLDYGPNNQVDHDVQKDTLRKQLRLAVQLNKPVVLHCREAEDECFSICKEILPPQHKIHRHCFTLCMRVGERWLDAFPNCMLGLTPLIVSPGRREAVLDTAIHCPLERLLIETDAPFFCPPFFQSACFENTKGGHPAMGITVALKLAELKNVDVQVVLRTIRENTRRLYGI